MLQLRVVRGPEGTGQEMSLAAGATIIVGRGDECDFRLNSPGVSKRHCRVSAVGHSKVEVEDLGSSNGTFVNGLLIKRHILKPGDHLVIHNYVLQVALTAPALVSDSSRGSPNDGFFGGASQGNAAIDVNAYASPYASASFPTGSSSSPDLSGAQVSAEAEGNRATRWLASNVYPWADGLSGRFDVRALVVIFFLAWSALIIFITAMPFAQRANERVQGQSMEVARLYARQLARVNQQAVIDQRYRDVVGVLDAKSGATPGLVASMVLDVSRAQVLAPPEMLGQSLPNPQAQKAITKDTPWSEVDDNGMAYVSAPIVIGTNEGNKTVATAYVMFDTLNAQFSTAALLDQAVTSLLYALVASLLVFVLVYRWINGSIERVTAGIDAAMKDSSGEVISPVRWPALAELTDQISSALGRGSSGYGASQGGGADPRYGADPRSEEWATAAANASGGAAAAFTSALVVTAWNIAMERLVGMRAVMAIGAELAEASRDIAFESAVRALVQEGDMSSWTPVSREVEFGGVNHKVVVVSGAGAYLLSIYPAEG